MARKLHGRSRAKRRKRQSEVVEGLESRRLLSGIPTHLFPGVGLGSNFLGNLAPGPDGNVYFASGLANQLLYMTPGGFAGVYDTTAVSPHGPSGIVAGPDGNVYFDEFWAGVMGELNVTTQTVSTVPLVKSLNHPGPITLGPDNNFWTATSGSITRVSVDGSSVTPFSYSGAGSSSIVSWNGELYFNSNNFIRAVTTSGSFNVAVQTLHGGNVQSIAVGPDGNLWFTEARVNGTDFFNYYGYMTPAGVMHEIALHAGVYGSASGIAAGSDGNIYFRAGGYLVESNTAGTVINAQNLGGGVGGAGGNVISGPNGNLWYNESFNDQIGTAFINGAAAPQLDLAATVNPGVALPGGKNFSWTINYSNPGTLASKTASITDTLPANTTLDTADSTAGWTNVGGTTYTYTLPTLDVSASGSVTIAATFATPPVPGTQIADALNIADDGSNGLDANTSNNVANNTLAAPSVSPDLASFSGIPFHLYPGVGLGSNFLQNMAPGPDGNVYFASGLANQLLYMTPTGYAQVYDTTQISPHGPRAIVAGPDGNVYFDEFWAGVIGELNVKTQTVTNVPLAQGLSGPTAMTLGPDGNLWTGGFSSLVNRVSLDGSSVTTFSYSGAGTGHIVSWNNELYFSSNNVMRGITTSGVFNVAVNTPSGGNIQSIAVGPDGNLWFTESRVNNTDFFNYYGYMTPAGAMHEFPINAAVYGTVSGITAGSDGNIYFRTGDYVVEANAAGTIINAQNLGGGSGGSGGELISGPNGNLWYNESFNDQIGTLFINGAPQPQLDLALSIDPGISLPGGKNFGWTVHYSNPGTLFSKTAYISDTLPANTTLDTADSSAGWKNFGGTTYTYALNPLDASQSGAVTIAATFATAPGAGAQIPDSGIIADDSSNGLDVNVANNYAVSSATPTPDLSVSVNTGGLGGASGKTLAYTINYQNLNNIGATGVVLTETLPQNTTFNAAASSSGWTSAGGSTYTYTVGSVAAFGAGGPITIAADIITPATAGTQIIDSVTSADDGTHGPDPLLADNTATNTYALPGSISSTFSVSGSATTAIPGKTIGYTLTVTNTGVTTVAGVDVSDLISPAINKGSVFYSASDNGLGATGFIASGAGAINDTVTLPAGDTLTYQIVGIIYSSMTGTCTSSGSATIPAGISGQQGIISAITGSASVTLTPKVELGVVMNGANPLHVGQQDVYSIVVTNFQAGAAASDATNATITTDGLSAFTGIHYSTSVLYTPDNAVAPSFGSTSGTVADGDAFSENFNLSAGSIIEFQITGTVAAGASGTLSNSAIVLDPGADVVSSNNVSAVTAAVVSNSAGSVVGRDLFYGNSFWDTTTGLNPSFGKTPDTALAPDKLALMPGQTARFNNYGSYTNGINGVFVDLTGDTGNIALSDFNFAVGNDNSPGGWSAAPTPASISLYPGAGVNGSDRVQINWVNGAILNQWLQVTVLPNQLDTVLAVPDVFYFGNAPADVGDSVTDARVNATDDIAIRNDSHTTRSDPATISNPHDLTRDSKVDSTDEIYARNHHTTNSTALAIITPSTPGVFIISTASPTQAATSLTSTATAQPSIINSPTVSTDEKKKAPPPKHIATAILKQKSHAVTHPTKQPIHLTGGGHSPLSPDHT